MTSTRLSERVFSNSDPHAIVMVRRKNYDFILGETRDLLGSRLPPRPLPEGVSPMGFPLLVRNRSSFMRRMLREGIVARPLWSELPRGVDESSHPTATRIGRHLVYMPVHQGLRSAQVERVGLVLRRLLQDGFRGEILDN